MNRCLSGGLKYIFYWISTLKGIKRELACVGWQQGITKSLFASQPNVKCKKKSALNLLHCYFPCSKMNSAQHGWKIKWGKSLLKAFRHTLVKGPSHDPWCWSIWRRTPPWIKSSPSCAFTLPAGIWGKCVALMKVRDWSRECEDRLCSG